MNTDYVVQVRVSLADYPQIAPVSATVTCKVLTCKLDNLVAPDDLQATYYIRTHQIEVGFAEFTQKPDCGYPITYSFEQASGSDLPAWISASEAEKLLSIVSYDINDQGQYTILVTGSTPEGYAYEQVTATM